MKFVVLIKADQSGKAPDAGSMSALAAAEGLRKEGDTVTAVSMGPEAAAGALGRCLAAGADDAFLLCDEAFGYADVYATARCLNAFIGREAPDYALIIAGEASSDSGTGMLPAELAEMLGRDQFYYTSKIERDGCWFLMTQDYGDEVRVCRTCGGSVVSVLSGAYPPADAPEGDPSAVKRLGRIDLGLGTFSVGERGSKIVLKDMGASE